MSLGEPSKKRRLDETEDDLPQAKIVCIDTETADRSVSLMDLSDEIWLFIFSQLDSETLYALAKCCSRLRNFIQEKTLWINADFRRKPLQAQQILKRLKFLNTDTKSLALRGMYSYYPLDKYKNVTITANMLGIVRDSCPQLEHLEIMDGYLDMDKTSIQHFPESLRTLKFTKCSTKVERIDSAKPPFFSKIDMQLKQLEELSLEECHFFDTHDLMSFSKIVNLTKLGLKGCSSLKDCVPYGSIATRFGFKQLEVLDIRDTPVSDSDIQSFNMTKKLKELLLECPVGYREDGDTSEAVAGTSGVQTGENGTTAMDEDEETSSDEEVSENGDVAAAEVQTPNPGVVVEGVQRLPDDVGPAPAENGAPPVPQQPPQPNVRIIIDGVQQLPDDAGPPPPPPNGNGDVPPFVIQHNNFGHADQQNIIHVVIHERNDEVAVQRHPLAPGIERHDIFLNAAPAGGVEERAEEGRPGIRLVRNVAPAAAFRQNHIIFVRRNNDGMAVNDDYLRPIPNIHNRFAPIAGYLRLENNLPNYQFDPPTKPLISDRGICSFGMSRNNIQQGVIWIRAEHRQPDTLLERIVVRHYKLVTDISLRHLSTCSPKLKYLDVTGTSVTQDGIDQFKVAKPDCVVVSNFTPIKT